MNPTDLIAYRHEIGDAMVLRLDGDLDHASSEDFRAAVAGATRTHADVVLDLRAVRHVDPTGLGVLTGFHPDADRPARRLCLAAPPESVHAMLHHLRLDQTIPTFDHADAALRWLAGGARSTSCCVSA